MQACNKHSSTPTTPCESRTTIHSQTHITMAPDDDNRFWGIAMVAPALRALGLRVLMLAMALALCTTSVLSVTAATSYISSVDPTSGSLRGGTLIILHGHQLPLDYAPRHDATFANRSRALTVALSDGATCEPVWWHAASSQLGCRTRPTSGGAERRVEPTIVLLEGANASRLRRIGCASAGACAFRFAAASTPLVRRVCCCCSCRCCCSCADTGTDAVLGAVGAAGGGCAGRARGGARPLLRGRPVGAALARRRERGADGLRAAATAAAASSRGWREQHGVPRGADAAGRHCQRHCAGGR